MSGDGHVAGAAGPGVGSGASLGPEWWLTHADDLVTGAGAGGDSGGGGGGGEGSNSSATGGFGINNLIPSAFDGSNSIDIGNVPFGEQAIPYDINTLLQFFGYNNVES